MKNPTPIAIRDKSPYSQKEQVWQYFVANPDRIILKPELSKFAKDKGFPENSVMSAVSHLARIRGITHSGRGQGYMLKSLIQQSN